MDVTHNGPGEAALPTKEPWKAAFTNGAFCALVAAMLLWGGLRDFTPPPEEPKSVEAVLEESEERSHWNRESLEIIRERSRITDAIDAQIETLEARRSSGGRDAESEAEIRRLRASWFEEMDKTEQLWSARDAARGERQRQRDAPRREQVARAAQAWERSRKFVLAASAAAWLLAGWLLWQARLLYARRPAARADSDAGDPQRSQKIPFYLLQVTVCVGVLLFGVLGADRHFDQRNPRDMVIMLGLFGLGTSTLWLFFGTIDWSKWNAIKDLVKGGRAAGETDGAQDDRD